MWPPPSARPALRLAGTLVLATAAALAARALHVPLPWMLGPLLATALCGVAGVPLRASNRLRNGGQWVIGIALGLYFTPAVLALIVRLAPAIALGVAWALLLGHVFHVVPAPQQRRRPRHRVVRRGHRRCVGDGGAGRTPWRRGSTASRRRTRCACCWWC